MRSSVLVRGFVGGCVARALPITGMSTLEEAVTHLRGGLDKQQQVISSIVERLGLNADLLAPTPVKLL